MAKSIIGAHASTGPGWSTPISEAPQPHWKTATMKPYAAPTDSRFITTAFTGTSTLRNTIISRRKLRISTAPIRRGRRPAM